VGRGKQPCGAVGYSNLGPVGREGGVRTTDVSFDAPLGGVTTVGGSPNWGV